MLAFHQNQAADKSFLPYKDEDDMKQDSPALEKSENECHLMNGRLKIVGHCIDLSHMHPIDQKCQVLTDEKPKLRVELLLNRDPKKNRILQYNVQFPVSVS